MQHCKLPAQLTFCDPLAVFVQSRKHLGLSTSTLFLKLCSGENASETPRNANR